MVYLITTREKDRSAPLRKVLNTESKYPYDPNAGFYYKVIDGFNGHKIKNPGYRFKKYYGSPYGLRTPDEMNKGEFGALMSHCMAITMAKADNLDYAIIFEDDARIPKNFRERWNRLRGIEMTENGYPSEEKGFPYDADILLLGGILLKEADNVGPFVSKYIRIVNNPVYGLHAYMVFKKGYDKILDIFYSMENVADDLILKNRELKIYMADPWIAYQSDDSSVIWPERNGPGIHSKFLYEE